MGYVMKLAGLFIVCGLFVASCGGNKSPSNEVNNLFPGADLGKNEVQMRCASQILSGSGSTVRYKSTYYAIGKDGTETIQSESEGPTPCP
jgi:hypothetical protein